MPASSAPELEIPATLHVTKVKWDARDFRYPGYYPAPTHEPFHLAKLKPYLEILAAAAVIGILIGIYFCKTGG